MNELSLFDSLFGNEGFPFPSSVKTYMPRVDVFETKENYVLHMDLPGKTEKDIDLSLKNEILTISSVEEDKKETQKNIGDTKWLIKERSSSSFKRTFALPKDVNTEKVSASFKNGVLEVTMPRRPEPEEKKIAIKIA